MTSEGGSAARTPALTGNAYKLFISSGILGHYFLAPFFLVFPRISTGHRNFSFGPTEMKKFDALPCPVIPECSFLKKNSDLIKQRGGNYFFSKNHWKLTFGCFVCFGCFVLYFTLRFLVLLCILPGTLDWWVDWFVWRLGGWVMAPRGFHLQSCSLSMSIRRRKAGG